MKIIITTSISVDLSHYPNCETLDDVAAFWQKMFDSGDYKAEALVNENTKVQVVKED